MNGKIRNTSSIEEVNAKQQINKAELIKPYCKYFYYFFFKLFLRRMLGYTREKGVSF